MSLKDRVLNLLEERRNIILTGKINCIPSPFNRFRSDFVGIEKGRYYLLSAHQKCGKTQFTSYTFIYHPLEYAYNNPDKVKLKIFYYPLEETKEEILLRYMSHLLFILSNFKIRISPTDLKSTDERKPLSEEILELLKSEEYSKRIEFFEKCVQFREASNPTGMWKDMLNYAESTGTIHYKNIEYVDRDTGEIKTKRIFDYYEPDDPQEYVLILWDHAGLTGLERGLDLRQSINKLSEYFVLLRNKYNFSPILVYQQSTETQNLEAFKSNKIRPTVAGLSDSKYPARDCSIMLGLTNPYAFEVPNYCGYDITKFKDNFRLLEIIVNRFGQSNGSIGLFFDGATNYFSELPHPSDTSNIQKIISWRDKVKHNMLFFIHYFKKMLKDNSKSINNN